jgi:hypothetical protein
MPQLSYTEAPVKAYEGGLADTGVKDIITKTNSTNQRTDAHVVNAVNAAVYTISLTDGNGDSDTATYTADGSATTTEIVAGLVAAVNALDLEISATAVDADDFYLESTNDVGGFTATSAGDTPTDLTLTTVVSEAQQIPFGRFVCRDEAHGDDYCRLPRLSTDIDGSCLGVAVSHTAQEPGTTGYANHSSVSILNKGRIWMVAEDAVTLGDAVYVRYTANGATKLPGMVRSDDDSSKAAALARAKFASTAGAGELVLVELA